MQNDLIERYVYAVTRRLPYKTRADVEQELRGLIEDMLEARCGEIPPSEQDVRVVLTELGTPDELAARYSPDKQSALIGPPYYTTYKLVLMIVLLCVAFGITVANVVILITNPGAAWYTTALSWLANTFVALGQGFAWVTLIFAIFQWRGVKLDTGLGGLDSLPEAPRREERIGRAGPIAGMVFTVLFTVVFLAAPQILGGWFDGSGFIPVLNVALIRQRWPLVVLMGLLGILNSSFELYEGRRTPRLAAFTVASDIVSLLLLVALFSGAQMINPAFLAALEGILGPDAAMPIAVLSRLNLMVIGAYLLAILLDIGGTVVAAVRSLRGRAAT